MNVFTQARPNSDTQGARFGTALNALGAPARRRRAWARAMVKRPSVFRKADAAQALDHSLVLQRAGLRTARRRGRSDGAGTFTGDDPVLRDTFQLGSVRLATSFSPVLEPPTPRDALESADFVAAVLKVRIHLPPAESQVRTCLSREFAFLARSRSRGFPRLSGPGRTA